MLLSGIEYEAAESVCGSPSNYVQTTAVWVGYFSSATK
jgi:hypothetical protein